MTTACGWAHLGRITATGAAWRRPAFTSSQLPGAEVRMLAQHRVQQNLVHLRRLFEPTADLVEVS